MSSALRQTVAGDEAVLGSDTAKFLGRTIPGRLNIVCVGAHPDDPESGCGGTLAKLAAEGHNVSVIYLTRGEAGVRGGEPETTAAVRSRESLQACEVLNGTAFFGKQIDGKTVADRENAEEFSELLNRLAPHIVFTHWPIDTHQDHRTAAALVYQAWQWAAEKFALVYYEVMSGIQTHHFQPNCFVDITRTWKQKKTAIYAHGSQQPDRFYSYHAEMEKLRGSEANYRRAEAFVTMRERLPKPLKPFEL